MVGAGPLHFPVTKSLGAQGLPYGSFGGSRQLHRESILQSSELHHGATRFPTSRFNKPGMRHHRPQAGCLPLSSPRESECAHSHLHVSPPPVTVPFPFVSSTSSGLLELGVLSYPCCFCIFIINTKVHPYPRVGCKSFGKQQTYLGPVVSQ